VARPLQLLDLGLVEYEAALALQRRLVAERQADARPDTLVLCEHPHVFTLGRRAGARAHVLAPGAVPVVEVERGGDVTYHGPGQLVGYPIFRLEPAEQDLPRFLRGLEEVLLRALATAVGLAGRRRPGYTGVWLGERKVASIGVAVTGWVTFHGFALNVATDLGYFDRIEPCGLPSAVMTTVSAALGRPVAPAELTPAVLAAVAEVFERAVATPSSA